MVLRSRFLAPKMDAEWCRGVDTSIYQLWIVAYIYGYNYINYINYMLYHTQLSQLGYTYTNYHTQLCSILSNIQLYQMLNYINYINCTTIYCIILNYPNCWNISTIIYIYMIIYVSHNWWIQMHTLFARPRHWSRSYLHRPGDLVYNNVIPPTMVQQWSLSYQYANFRCFLGHIMRDTEILVGGIPTPLKNMSNQLGISWQWEISNHNRGDIISLI